MPALDTVGKMVAQARVLLQDNIEPFRYPDDQLIDTLNIAFLDARRLRPDMFLSSPSAVPFYTLFSETITVDQQYRMAFVWYMVGQATMRDEEDVQDARAAAFINKFTDMLTRPHIPLGVIQPG